MTRCLLILSLLLAPALAAGDYADDVKDLGDKNLRSSAIEKLSAAGAEAFDDLLDGLKQDPDAEGITAEEKSYRSMRRLECARLLGTLADTRASADLVALLTSQAVEAPKYAVLGAACASALGNLWSSKEASANRNEISLALKKYAADTKLDKRIRWGSLHGLAAMKEGGAEALTILTELAKSDDPAFKPEDLLRSACIEIIVATKHKAAAETLLDLWDTQRFGKKGEDGNRSNPQPGDLARPIGTQALFALASLGDKRAVPGLVDVCTLNEFVNFIALRDQAVRYMKEAAHNADALASLVATFKDVDKPMQRNRAAQTLGDLGASGVTAFLDVADDEAPKPKEGEPADKYPADYFAKQVDSNLSSLRSDEALTAFVDAYGKLPAESKTLREKIIEHLLNNRNSLKVASVGIFRTAADDEGLEAPKRANAINAWAEAKGKESLPDLERWVKHADGVIRAQAVQNLGRTYIPLKMSLPLLKEALLDKAETFTKARENALMGLQRSDDKELLPLFIDSLDPAKETSGDVRNAALKAIEVYRRNARVQDDQVYPAVKARTSDTDANVRATAVAKASNMAQLMGNKTEAVEIVHKALTDSSDEVRLQAYSQVSMLGDGIDTAKLMDAALKEDKPEMKGHAVGALSNAAKGSFGTDTERHKLLIDMALSVIDDRVRESQAKDLVGKLADGAAFNHASDKIRARITELTGDRKEYSKVPVLIRTLIAINDDTYFSDIEDLAQQPNVELRRACIEYIKTLGAKKDVDFLRKLGEKTDAAAANVKQDIEAAIAVLQER